MPFNASLPPIWREVHDLGATGAGRLVCQALLTGAVSGGVIGLFRIAYTRINAAVVALVGPAAPTEAAAVACLFGVLCLMAAAGGWLLRIEPLISGSGIPQVELMIAGRIPPMRCLRVLFAKFTGTLISLSAGLSVGREGPCIQMGAAVGLGVGRLFREGSGPARYLVGGGVAGMTAAFGAPLAGMLFAFEEMRMVLAVPLVLFCGLSALGAWLVISLAFDLGLVFPFRNLDALAPGQWWLVAVLGPACGVAGAAYNRLLVGLTLWEDRLQDVLGLPGAVRVLLPFLCAGGLLLAYPQVIAGFGPDSLSFEAPSLALSALLILLLVKVAFSCVSFASGVSGGLLMPMLLIGLMLGGIAAQLLLTHGLVEGGQCGLVLTLCMAGLFAATVRAPLTGSALLLEMTGAWANAPAVVAAALAAAFTANRLGSAPVYDAIKRRIMKRRARAARIARAKGADAVQTAGEKNGGSAVTHRN
ncbi:MAG: chloride channel protein [Desulfovibrio sp.]|nr:chloride channel protein [Desulfovibrio sp.]